MVRIGGICFDTALTAEAKIYTVTRTSLAGRAVMNASYKGFGRADSCLSEIAPVVPACRLAVNSRSNRQVAADHAHPREYHSECVLRV